MKEISVTDASDLRRYRTEIPNVVLSLGLTPFELALYVHLKRTAGDDGSCWKSTATLADESGMSTGMVIKAREGLKKPRVELDGKPLITDITDSSHPGRARHLITITGIWVENFASFDARQKSPHDVQKSCGDVQKSPHDIQKSPHDIKKEPLEERTSEEVCVTRSARSTPRRQAFPLNPVTKATRSPDAKQGSPPDANSQHPAVAAYLEVCGVLPNRQQRKDIIAEVTDLDRWRSVLTQFMREGQKAQRVDWTLERYANNGLRAVPAAPGVPPSETAEDKARKQEELKARARGGGASQGRSARA